MTRGRALLLGLAVFLLGAAGYGLFQRVGLEAAQAGIAAQAMLVLIVLGWTGTYLVRVVSGRMTFMEQRRRYRAGYDAATDDALMRRFEELSPEQQRELLEEVGQVDDADRAESAGL
ncbi:DUF3007 family protein [Synechococcus sp. RSCCF101]|uniref:DUF3007 family protein n=1 Tax=Synechococcus sp. RSCCF101 TaxID=2511069 RepID=UPI0012460AD9|nr:DUF3007 family protein [Synechococcus sp. RSCCF101]QEY32065.1 DUF3007 family protein [Synechococcus sp. RSCCF101]